MELTGRKSIKGFTLIELLVVIAIIAILAAILFPVFATARGKARQITGSSNLKQLALGILQYNQDNDERFPRTGYGGTCGPSADGSLAAGECNQAGALDWQNTIAPYVKSTGVYVSPGDASTPTSWFAGDTDFTYSNGLFSVMMNDLLAHPTPAGAGGYADETKQQSKSDGSSLARITAPSDCILLAEGHGGWNKCTAGDGAECTSPDAEGNTALTGRFYHEHTISGNCTFFLTGTDYAGDSFFSGLPFYTGGTNFAFTDGHVKWTKTVDASGKPIICSTMPWAKHMDPEQRMGPSGDNPANYCGGDNPLPGGWQGHQWY